MRYQQVHFNVISQESFMYDMSHNYDDNTDDASNG